MIPMRIVETDRPGFAEPVVELWREDEFIGMVFWDDETAVVQIYPDDDGDVKDLEARELMRVLDLAEQIVSPDLGDEFGEMRDAIRVISGGAIEGGEEAIDDWDDEDPAVTALLTEFDSQAVHRTEDGEGFFPLDVAKAFIARCDELNLAVVEMEGFDFDLGRLIERPNLSMLTRVDTPTSWAIFRPAANARAAETLDSWHARDTLVIAFVFQLPTGDQIVA